MQSPELTAEDLLKIHQTAEDLLEIRKINAFVEHYNKVSGPGKQKLRIETDSPHIYVIGVNIKPPLTINEKKVLLVKVGFTEISVEKGTDNRMEQVADKVKSELQTKYKISDDNKLNVSILFKLPVFAIDTRPLREVETAIRNKIGFPLPTEKAKELGLPVPTEWAVTTQEYVNKRKKDKELFIKEKDFLSTKIFKSEPGDSKKCNLARELNMTDKELIENLTKLQFQLEKADSPATAKKATKKSMSTPEKSPPAGESATPGARAIKTPGKTSSAGASRTAPKGRGKKPSTTDSLPGTPNMKDEDFTETFKELSVSSASTKKTTKKTMATPEKSPPAGESSTPEPVTTGPSRPATKGSGKKSSATGNK